MARDVHKQTGDRVVFVTRKKHQPGGAFIIMKFAFVS